MPASRERSQLCLIVDGGGSKTACRIVERSMAGTGILGNGQSTGSNPAELGIEAAAASIQTAIKLAATQAGLAPSADFDRAALAIAGTLNEPLRQGLEDAITAGLAVRRCRVFPDILPPVLAAGTSGPAIGLIAGTGSVAVARGADGRYSTAGGWGYLLGDEGSGYAIGRELLRAALVQLESAASSLTPLTTRVLKELRVESIADIKREVYGSSQPRRTIASLARLLVAPDESVDAEGQPILQVAAANLARLALRTSERLDVEWQALPVAAAGGLFAADGIMREIFARELHNLRHKGAIAFVDDPLDACLALLDDDVFNAPLELEDR